MSKQKLSEDVLRQALDAQRLGSRAAQKAQQENRRLGLPNTYSRNGIQYYELPDGTITDQSPFEKDGQPKS